jgi:uncharacterized protein (DUF362 family)
MNDHNPEISRREFLNRSVKAGLAITLAGGLSYLLYDPVGPGKDVLFQNFKVPDFSRTPVKGQTLAIVHGRERKASLKKSVELLGGIGRFVKPGQRVLIKPNIAFASSPDLCATTHPDIVSELVRLCYAAGAKTVSVLDNPINDPASCFLLSGIEKAAQENGAKIIYPEAGLMKPITLHDARLIRNWPLLLEPLLKADVLIGAAPLKNHHRSGASMTMKNWYGLLGGRRNLFHQDIHTIISELATLIRPSLVILDGIDLMISNGPTGGSLADLKPGNTLIASCDQVAADTFGASLLGLQLRDLPYLIKAEKAGNGTTDFQSLKPIIFTEG